MLGVWGTPHTHTHTLTHTHTHTHTLSLFGIGTRSPCTPVHHNQGSREGRTWGLERAPCKTQHSRDFPAGTVVKTLPPKAGGAGLIPGRGTKIPHALGPKNQNIKQKRNCNTFSKNFKNDPHQKKKNLKKPSTPIFSKRTALQPPSSPTPDIPTLLLVQESLFPRPVEGQSQALPRRHLGGGRGSPAQLSPR